MQLMAVFFLWPPLVLSATIGWKGRGGGDKERASKYDGDPQLSVSEPLQTSSRHQTASTWLHQQNCRSFLKLVNKLLPLCSFQCPLYNLLGFHESSAKNSPGPARKPAYIQASSSKVLLLALILAQLTSLTGSTASRATAGLTPCPEHIWGLT